MQFTRSPLVNAEPFEPVLPAEDAPSIRRTGRLARGVPALALATAMTVVLILLAVPSFSLKTPALDEGILLAYPTHILRGEVPLRDFETYYGPATYYSVAGAFAVLGEHLDVERGVGLAYHLAIALVIFCLALPWGRLTALGAGAISGLVLLVALALPAYAYLGAIAALLAAILLASPSSRAGPDRRALRSAGVGFLCGLSLLFRFDAALAAALVLCAVLVRNRCLSWRYALAGCAAVTSFYVPYVLVAGWTNTTRMIEHVVADRPARHLAFPGFASGPGLELAAAVGISLGILLLGAARLRRAGEDAAGRRLLAVSAMTLAFVPYALSRTAPVQVTIAAAAALPFALPAAVELLGILSPGRSLIFRQVAVTTGLILLAALALVVRPPGTKFRQRLGLAAPAAYRVAFHGRYYYDESADAARALNRLVPLADRLAGPHGSVFVGQLDLRRADYNDAAVYFLLADLKPATRYLELASGGANNADSGLAKQVSSADILLLTDRFDGWGTTPHARWALGPAAPNTIVRKHFCRRAAASTYVLLQHCR